MHHAIHVGAVLIALWLILSGMFEILFLGLGLLSVAFVTYISLRMDVADHEGDAIYMHIGFIRHHLYWVWLMGQIAKSSVDVTWRILHPRLPISPCLIRVRGSQTTEMGLVKYANSITRTPGTASVDLQGQEIEVHALTREGAEDLRRGEMDRRITALEEKS